MIEPSLDSIKNFDPDKRTIISFSGGKTSAYMTKTLWGLYRKEYLDQSRIRVIFANTGREREETLEFIRDFETQFKIPVIWVEYDLNNKGQRICKVVDFTTASRNGEPFEKLIRKRKMVPNPTMRFCTDVLKINTIRMYLKIYESGENERRYKKSSQMVVGIRYDEGQRINRESAQREMFKIIYPLFDWQVTSDDIHKFWEEQPFNLKLKSYEGNCDLCFLKRKDSLIKIIKNRPETADWWIQMEDFVGNTFKRDVGGFKNLREFVLANLDNIRDEKEDTSPGGISCFCTD